MEVRSSGRWRGVGRVALWALSGLLAIGIGLAGAAKFTTGRLWSDLFVGWGYPPWLAQLTGGVELAGAIGLLVPRLARYAAGALGVVMAGAVVTLLTHPGGKMGWGGTPLAYLTLLLVVGYARRHQARRLGPE